MVQDPRYNYDFTDADAARLVHAALLANQPQHRYHTCGWVTNQGICSVPVQAHEFAEHLRIHHGVIGLDGAQLRCCWVNCSAEMKKEMLTKHVQEKHLELRYACPNCDEQFTRSNTLHNHILRQHSDSF